MKKNVINFIIKYFTLKIQIYRKIIKDIIRSTKNIIKYSLSLLENKID